jgi:hypothetical protein
MKRQKSCGPRLGKLVHQLPGVVTFAYDLRFRRVIARWKGIVEEIHFGGSIMPLDIIENLYLKKPSFRPSKWPRKLKPAKNSKLPKLPENCFEPVGKGGWPPISTYIIRSFMECFHLEHTISLRVSSYGSTVPNYFGYSMFRCSSPNLSHHCMPLNLRVHVSVFWSNPFFTL